MPVIYVCSVSHQRSSKRDSNQRPSPNHTRSTLINQLPFPLVLHLFRHFSSSIILVLTLLISNVNRSIIPAFSSPPFEPTVIGDNDFFLNYQSLWSNRQSVIPENNTSGLSMVTIIITLTINRAMQIYREDKNFVRLYIR